MGLFSGLFDFKKEHDLQQAEKQLDKGMAEFKTSLEIGLFEQRLRELDNAKQADSIIKAFNSLLSLQCEGEHRLHLGAHFYKVEFKNGKLTGFKELD